MTVLLIRNVRPLGAAAVDIRIDAGKFTAIGTNLPAPTGATIEDGANALALPGLIEGHSHLDKTLWGLPFYRNAVGPSLSDKIDNERHLRASVSFLKRLLWRSAAASRISPTRSRRRGKRARCRGGGSGSVCRATATAPGARG